MKKIAIITTSTLIFLLALYLIFYKGSIKFSSEISGLKVEINKKTYSANEKIKLRPGTYTVRADGEGYEALEKEVTVGVWKELKANLKLSPKEELLITSGVKSPEISEDKKSLYFFDTKESTLARMDLETKEKESISSTINMKIDSVSWSPDKKRAIVFQKNSNKRVSGDLYNTETKVSAPLPEGTRSPVTWSKDSQRFAYSVSSLDGFIKLKISNRDGQETQDIIDILPPNFLKWLNDGKIFYYPEGSDDENISSYIIDPVAKQMTEFLKKNITDIKTYYENGKEVFLYETSSDDGAVNLFSYDFSSSKDIPLATKSFLEKFTAGDGGDVYRFSSEKNLLNVVSTETLVKNSFLNEIKETTHILSAPTYAKNPILLTNNRIIFTSEDRVYIIGTTF